MASINITNKGLIVGSEGDDAFVLQNGASSDMAANTMIGGLGNDFYEVDSDTSVVVEQAGQGIDTVRLTDNYNGSGYYMGDDIENVQISDQLGWAYVEGNDANNVIAVESSTAHTNAQLYGGAGADTLRGDAGNNYLVGGTGADVMQGFDGNDQYWVDNVGDQVIENSASGGSDSVTASVSYALTANVENLYLQGSAAINGTGNELDNTLYGNSGNNILSGGAGNDTLSGEDGNDRLDGGAGDDYLADGYGNNVLLGSIGNDFLFSGYGDDTLDGGADNDILNAGHGNNVLLGGLGNDTLTSGSGNDMLDAGDGNDVLNAGHGNNVLLGGAGNDDLQGGYDNDRLDGGAGNDAIVDNYGGNNVVIGGAGNDDIAVQGNNVIDGGLGNDTITTSDGGDIVDGGEGDDVIVDLGGGWAEKNILRGGNGNDLIVANADGGEDVGNTLDGGAGNDILVDNSWSMNNYGNGDTPQPEVLIGGAGDDQYYVRVAQGLDKVQFIDVQGNDTIHLGGEVLPQLGINNPNFTLSSNTVTVVQMSLATGIENIDASAAGVSTYLVGNTGNNLMIGSELTDVLVGGLGNDVLDGRGGSDNLLGGAGNDTYIVNDGNDTIYEVANEGIDTVYATTSLKLESNVENVTLFGSDNLHASGNGLDNVLVGNSGSNAIFGGSGNDVLRGNGGVDTLVGGSGNDNLDGGNDGVEDTLYGNDGNDVLAGYGSDRLLGGQGNDIYNVSDASVSIVESSDEGTDNVFASSSYTLGANLENLTLSGTAGYAAVGNDLVNYLKGNDGDNVLRDDVSFGAGNSLDTLDGGKGNDQYFVEWGNAAAASHDKIIESTAGGDDTVHLVVDTMIGTMNLALGVGELANIENLDLSYGIYSSGSFNVLGSAVDNVIFGSSLNDRMAGGLGNDFLLGEDGNDTLAGDAGNDTLIGGNGTDSLSGGLGNDTLNGGVGNDFLNGGDGNDVYFIDGNDMFIDSATTAGGIDSVIADANVSVDLNGKFIENAQGTAFTADIALTGSSGNNVLGAYADGGDVTMIGDAGNDTYVLLSNNGGVNSFFINESTLATGGFDTVNSYLAGNVTLADGVEKLVLLGNNGSGAYGNALNNTLVGNDNFNTLDGGAGIDRLEGGNGNDTYIVDNTADVVIETATGGYYDSMQVVGNGNFVLAANIEQGSVGYLVGSTDAAAANLFGNALDNTLYGNALNNTLDGGLGNDNLFGNDGDDRLLGGAGNDYLDGGNGNDALLGGIGDDDLSGGFGDDSLVGDVGNDHMDGSFGNDVLLGGIGNDNMFGGNDNDTLVGDVGNDNLTGGNGSDTLIGGLGNDIYFVDTTLDLVTEATLGGVDTVYVQSTGDTSFTLTANVENMTAQDSVTLNLYGNALGNTLTGNSADNTLDGGAGNDVMLGAGGNDTYFVDSSADMVVDLSFAYSHDTVFASTSFNLASNGVGIDDLFLSSGTAAVSGIGNELANTITVFGGGAAHLQGGGGADTLTGGSGADNLLGGAGNDVLDGGLGADTLTGGIDDDTYYVNSGSDVINEAFNEGRDVVFTTVNYRLDDTVKVENMVINTTLDGITVEGNSLNNLLMGSSGADTLKGMAGNDTLIGNAGNDVLDGGAGNDTLLGSLGDDVLDGGVGDDTLAGGTGDDTYYVDSISDEVFEDVSAGTDTVNASISYTLGNDVENLTLTGTDVIDGTGNDLANVITGNAANNSLFGMAGDDTYYVDSSLDLVFEGVLAGTDTVNASVSYTLANDVENLTLTGTDVISGTGNDLANVITGNDSANTLSGLDGNDTLNGGAGNDQLIGGAGNDVLDGGVGGAGGAGGDTMVGGTGDDTYVVDGTADLVVENAAEGTDSVNASVSYSLGADVENLTLTGTDVIDGTGNGLANVITGNAGDNVLTGGLGADNLTGGAGSDIFVFNDTTDVDTVTDFDEANDFVNLDSIAFANLVDVDSNGVLDVADFDAAYDGVTWAVGGEHVAYDSGSGNLSYSDLGDGSDALVIANLGSGLSLTNANLLVL